MASLECFVYFALIFGNMCFYPLKNRVITRTCLLSPPAGRRMKIPRTREGKPRILCYPHSIPRRGALAVATAGVEPSVTARQTWSDPGAGALSVGSPACLPSSADSPTTPPASCPKPDDALRVHSRLSHIRKTRLFNTPKVIDYTQPQRKANRVTAANAVFFPPTVSHVGFEATHRN